MVSDQKVNPWDPKNILPELYPPFAMQIENWMNVCWEKIDPRPYLWCGVRTFAEQNALYEIGRNGLADEKIVTRARGGYSIHQYGMAVDIVADGSVEKPGLQPAWEKSEWYYELYEIADRLFFKGLEWSGNWKHFQETCHFQNTFGLDLKALQGIWYSIKVDPDDGHRALFYRKIDDAVARLT